MSFLHALFSAWLRFEINREGVKLKVKQSNGSFFHLLISIFSNIWLFDLINFPLESFLADWIDAKEGKSFWIPLIGHSPETSAAFSDNLLPQNCILFAKSRLNNLWTPSENMDQRVFRFLHKFASFFLPFFSFHHNLRSCFEHKKNVFLCYLTWMFLFFCYRKPLIE